MLGEARYHLQATGKKAGYWVVCKAEQQCRLGGEHIDRQAADFINQLTESKAANALRDEYMNTDKSINGGYNNVPDEEIFAVVEEVSEMLAGNEVSIDSLDYYSYDINGKVYTFKRVGEGDIHESIVDGSSYVGYTFLNDSPDEHFDINVFVTDDGRIIVQNPELDYFQCEVPNPNPSLLTRAEWASDQYKNILEAKSAKMHYVDAVEATMEELKESPDEWNTFKEIFGTDEDTYLQLKSQFPGAERIMKYFTK